MTISLYSRGREPSPRTSRGQLIEREARDWIPAKAELKNTQLFENGEGSIR